MCEAAREIRRAMWVCAAGCHLLAPTGTQPAFGELRVRGGHSSERSCGAEPVRESNVQVLGRYTRLHVQSGMGCGCVLQKAHQETWRSAQLHAQPSRRAGVRHEARTKESPLFNNLEHCRGHRRGHGHHSLHHALGADLRARLRARVCT
jgi:hypothetical protein